MYGSSVWNLHSKSKIDQVLKIEKRAANVILDTDERARSVILFNNLQWLPFHKEANINKLSMLYQRINDKVLEYIRDILTRNCDIY